MYSYYRKGAVVVVPFFLVRDVPRLPRASPRYLSRGNVFSLFLKNRNVLLARGKKKTRNDPMSRRCECPGLWIMRCCICVWDTGTRSNSSTARYSYSYRTRSDFSQSEKRRCLGLQTGNLIFKKCDDSSSNGLSLCVIGG